VGESCRLKGDESERSWLQNAGSTAPETGMLDTGYDWEVMATTSDVAGHCAWSVASVDRCYVMCFE
jgi:hypothetical protein